MKVVVAFSGGLDSTVLLSRLLADGHSISKAISVDYGQRHRRELRAAKDIIRHFEQGHEDITHTVVDLRKLTPLLAGSSQTSRSIPVPTGHYSEESMKATVVPNRNMILLSIMAAAAIECKADAVAFAAHAGDHAIYPDCRPEFVDAMNAAIRLCDWHPLVLMAPFIAMTKTDIVKTGNTLQSPFSMTWSCYSPKTVSAKWRNRNSKSTVPPLPNALAHCGSCGTCIERREAFMLAGVPDPTEYHPSASRVELKNGAIHIIE